MSKKPIKQGEMLTTTTIRIEACDYEGNIFTGTGFYYSISQDHNAPYIPVIITNRHVIENMRDVLLVLTKADEFGNRIHELIKYKLQDISLGVVFHPDPEVDLCALTLYPIIVELRSQNIEIYTYYVDKSIIPNSVQMSGLDAIEEIIMVGYPDGIWDELNNLPITRKGITATDPKVDYNGDKEFLIDTACFPGSSGSPVYYYDKTHKTQIQDDAIGYRVSLLGILYSGPQTLVEGTLNRNAELKTKPYLHIPINLGYVIKSERLLELEVEIVKMV